MKLDRNTDADGCGKYVVINTRKMDTKPRTVDELIEQLKKHPEAVEFGAVGSEDEFFVIKLKDKYAASALTAYSLASATELPVFATEVSELALRAGRNNPFCKTPD